PVCRGHHSTRLGRRVLRRGARWDPRRAPDPSATPQVRRSIMRKIGLLIALAGATAGLVLGVSSGSARDRPTVISLLSVQQGGTLIDVDRSGGRGPTLGDEFIFTDGLYRWNGTKRGKRVGTTHGIATITSPTTAFFTATIFLPGGLIQGAGYFDFTARV